MYNIIVLAFRLSCVSSLLVLRVFIYNTAAQVV